MTRSLTLVSCFLLSLTALSSAQQGVFNPLPVFDGGGMRMMLSMRGQLGFVHPTESGLFWPGDGVSVRNTRNLCYTSTPVLVGNIQRKGRRVSASYYRDNFIPGPIIDGKHVANPTDPMFRAYTVNWQGSDELDYLEWPLTLGAPAASDGTPYFYGPSQMFWVMNDLDTAAMRQNNGTDPMGLEMRCLLYEPWSNQASDNTMLLQVTYINQGTDSIHDAYAGYFMDVDIRDAFANFAGSDSSLGMVYAYSGRMRFKDNGMPVAFGLAMLQTPAVAAPGEKARWFEGWKADARNIPITAAVMPTRAHMAPIKEPELGYDVFQWYNLMQGRGMLVHVVNPITGVPSRFWLSGDPVRGTGWLPEHGIQLSDGRNLPHDTPRDVRVMISAGPFDFAPGDTQQVTYAFIAARGATPQAAIHELRDRADFLRAMFLHRPPATAYRNSEIHAPVTTSGESRFDATARFADIPVDLRVEVTNASGNILHETPLDRTPSEGEWTYRTTVLLPEARQEGVNISFVSEWNGETMRMPGRVSFPVGGDVDLDGIAMLEEGDYNGRVAPEEEAKWFPRFVNRSPYSYNLYAQSYYMPNAQWLHVPELDGQSIIPSSERPWTISMGYSSLWDPAAIQSSDSIAYKYDVYDPAWNVWWECVNWIPTDSTAEDWYDVLMTQVRGVSDERPGVRLVDLAALEDTWYVASIHGKPGSRTLSLHDSATGIVYFEGHALDRFAGAAPLIDGFRVVHGTISKDWYTAELPATEADLFVFNPRHVLLGRGWRPADALFVSQPSPMPLNTWTSVQIDVPEASVLRAEVYNTLGRRVSILSDEYVQAGRHLLVWDGYWNDGRPADSGMYLFRIVVGTNEITRKMLLVR